MSQIDLPTDFDFQRVGREVLEIEREGLAQLDQYINEDFTHACEKIFRCAGKVVVMGMGKSGHIGVKWRRRLPAPVRRHFSFTLAKRPTAI
ncbi:Arabinose 5-phosphate isomerase KdsD [Raoultella planticola]|nr:Arabinose 5-phosphate isomerase KdsD [Raoultella planticola]